MLWHIRQSRVRSHEHRLIDLIRLDGRVDAHADAIAVAGRWPLPLLRAGLASEDPADVFASIYGALRSGLEELIPDIADRVATCTPDVVEGVAGALAHAPGDAWVDLLAPQLEAQTLGGAVACEVFARREDARAERGSSTVRFDDPDETVRLWAWRAAWHGIKFSAGAWEAALADASASIRSAAIEAGAWAGQVGLLDHLRRADPVRDPTSWLSLAQLAEDEREFARLLETASGLPPPVQARTLGALGHPRAIPPLLEMLSASDARVATTAAAALTRITGWDIDSPRVESLPPEDADPTDEVAMAFEDMVVVPDPEKARALWREQRARFESAARWNRGLEVGRGVPALRAHELDLEALRSACWRARMAGEESWTPARLETLPQPRLPGAPR